jgi:hypothetical protein
MYNVVLSTLYYYLFKVGNVVLCIIYQVKVTLRPTVSRSVRLGAEPHLGHGQISISG